MCSYESKELRILRMLKFLKRNGSFLQMKTFIKTEKEFVSSYI
jgi:hypothetical protein